ncbi:amino acid adenylation domain protein (plasmid) [Scytonema sp. HK-05]|uniref:non-ribosomal peptide synthetase family protein n=1 Tax=Scytonema sp. HK-05 TaxID=1137095 RepID=UPI000936575E|nr:non-ribosomal peptide synthetase [Scytonema sp. HK-05]OKH59459.1 non-ribosomal peptide synthetase [Scytonema sp. HK-05]BAY50145.1 amino acid adenylation domain protein [Scytonema sp. HK-05]
MKKNNIEDIYQLSPMQQGMLFHTLYAPDSGVYYQQFTCTFKGKLDIEAFSAAWQQVVARHAVLRTAFIWERKDQPVQVVYRQVKLPIEIHSWIELSADKQQQQLQAFLESDQNRGFELSKAPLMRLTLIQMSDDVYQFVWSYHHILLDGWSLPLVFKEVLGCYEAKSLGQQLQLPPTRSYREYIAWLQKQNLAVAEQFWRQTLLGVTAPTPLVVDTHHSNQVQQSYSEEILTLSTAATSALVMAARQHQLTLNTLVQAAWAILLSRYSSETDVVFGVTVSGRSPGITGVESIVGLFINTLPMRVTLSNEDTVLAILKQIHKQQVEISTYEYTSLVQIQQMTDVPRGLPLFESIVVFENYPVDEALQQNSQKLHISDVRAFERTNYPLTVVALPGKQLSLRFVYDSQRFESASVTRMMGHFQTLLEGIVTNPNQRLADLPLLNVSERQQLLFEWNDTQTEYPQDKCIHQLFEEQVELTPDAVALVYHNEQLTYRELNTRANQLAHYLLKLGVGPEVLVGICVERSLEMIVGLLGIWKAGGAYVPLDPTYPQERLAYMLSDSQVSVLLTQEKLVADLPAHTAHMVCLDSQWEVISCENQENLLSNVQPSDLAYVIYTSGSTGKPKGVLIAHQGLCNLAQAGIRLFDVNSDSRVLQFASFSFDASIYEVVMTLCCGARLCLGTKESLLPGPNLMQSLRTYNITHVTLPPSALAVLPYEELPVQTMIVAGEACSPDLVAQWSKDRRFFNAYGPTESTVCATVAECTKSSNQLSIGRPIANTQIYILDSHLQPVPIGVTGELYIGGAGVARGYLNRPELTQEKFILNPFSQQQGARLYKTGDLARYLPDGNIEFLGRIDHQVKIRGFRIELGEIEALLSQHPSVKQVLVIDREDVPGDKRLVAYIVHDQEQVPKVSELRSLLKEKLPDYMVPSAFVMLEAMPLTPNGKVNRKALPAPDTLRPDLEETFVAPRTSTEEVLAEIWTQVLRQKQVGVYDNFFDLGGHSLIATQLLFRVQNTFKLELPLHALLETPTVAGMAEAIDNVRDSKPTPSATISVTNLNAEAVLDETICPVGISVESIAHPARIFLTGATGFLGAFLLYELLQQTNADIYCLVRSSNVEEGKKKIQANLQSYSLWNECFSSRIISVLGDLSQPLFGLSNQEFQLLASTIDVIYHNGALVNFVDPYPKLKAANVLGTQEALRLASQIKVKPVHYISSIAVFPWEEDFSKDHVFRENDSLDRGLLAGGYEQTKWVAEKLVTIARNRGLPVYIYRPGRVSGHSQTGTCNTDDLMSRMIKGCIQLGSVPDFNMMVDLTPVDYASKCIVHLSMQKKFLEETFHVVNPLPAHWSNVMTWLRSFGYSLKVISYDQWRAELLKVAEHSSENPLYSLIPFFGEEAPDNSVKFDCQNTLNSLVGTSITCPSVSAELLNTYLSYYVSSGFLSAPQQIEQVGYELNKAPEAMTL